MRLQLYTILLLVLLCATSASRAQSPGVAPLPSTKSVRPVLVEVKIVGNSSVSTLDIEARILTIATSTSTLNQFADIVRPASGRMAAFLRMYARESIDIRYLNKALVEEDKESITRLYNERGFHHVKVRAVYGVDTANNTAKVRFDIQEGARAAVRWVQFEGLDGIPADLRSRIEETAYLHPGDDFDLVNINFELRRALDMLRNSGYAFASQGRPPVARKCDTPECKAPLDGIMLFINPGLRYRFGKTYVEHDTVTGRTPVSESLIRERMTYKQGEWFSWRDVDETRRNLYRLGVFDQISVDTTGAAKGDSMSVRIAYRMRKLNEIEASVELGVAQRADELVYTAGVSSRYSRLNLFGRGMRGSFGGRLQGRPEIGPIAAPHFPWVNFQEAEFGIDGRLDVPSPVILPVDVAGISAGYNRAVEDREGDAGLLSTRFLFGLEGGWNFPSYTLINGISVRALYQNNTYTGVEEYIRAKADALIDKVVLPEDGCSPDEVRQNLDDIVQTLAGSIYRVQVLQGDSPGLAPSPQAREESSNLKQTFIIGASAIGDHRNDFFSPTKGYFIQGRVDLGLTGWVIGEFVRLEADLRRFFPIGKTDVIASRLHLGAIGQLGGFPLTPINSRFHVGGANSVRGWGAREMLLTSPPTTFADPCTDTVYKAILDDSRRLLGGLMLFEGSVEFRKRVSQSLVVVGFADAGNAFFQNYSEDQKLATPKTVIENIGLAVGIDIGYETPAGPVRVGYGFRLYDPIDQASGDRWFWQHPFSLGNGAFHFSIGYAY